LRLCILTEPQLGASYGDLLRVALRAEECGFDGFFRSDHYLSMWGDGKPGPTDAWLTLAGLARETSRIRLGTLVSPVTFRLPGPLALGVAQVDAMSGGRVELGLGAGWFESEHRSHGIKFPSVEERFDRLAEQLEIITGLWATPAESTFSFQGRWYELSQCPPLPRPTQVPYPPVIVGGKGRRRTSLLASRFADEYNVPSGVPAVVRDCLDNASEQCSKIDRVGGGRAPLTYSVAVTVCCGRNDAEVRRRADAIGRDPAVLRPGELCGTPAEVIERLQQLRSLGASRAFLQVLDLSDLDHLDLIASEVMPALMTR
jgi:F420-dependent oxidoreductase-like protein